MKCLAVYSFVFVCMLGTKLKESSATFEKESTIDGSTHFLKSLSKNVENYKQIHFTWNIRNLNKKQFISLRLRENEDENLFEGIDVDWNPQNIDYTNILRDNTSENKPPKIRYRTKFGDMSSQNRYQTTPYGYKEVLYSQKMKTVTPDLTKSYVHSALVKKSDSNTEKELYSQSVIDSNIEELSPQIMRLVDKMPDGKRQSPEALFQRSDSRGEIKLSLQSEIDNNEEVSIPQIMRLVIDVPEGGGTIPIPNEPNQESESTSERDLSFQPEINGNDEVLNPQIMRLVDYKPDRKRKLPNNPNQRSEKMSDKDLFCKPEIDSNKEVLSPQIMRLIIYVPDESETSPMPSTPNQGSDSRSDKDISIPSEIGSNEEVLSPQIMRLVVDKTPIGKRRSPNALVKRSDSLSEKKLFQPEIDSSEEVLSPQIMRLIIDVPDVSGTSTMPNDPNRRSDSRSEKDFSCIPEIDNNEEVSSPQIMRLIIYVPDESETSPMPNTPNQGTDLRREKDISFQSEMDSYKEVLGPQIMRLIIDPPEEIARKTDESEPLPMPNDPYQRSDLRREKELSCQPEKERNKEDGNKEVLSPQIMRLVDYKPDGKRQSPDDLVQRSYPRSEKELFFRSVIDTKEEVSSPQIMRYTPPPQQVNNNGHNAHVKRQEVRMDKDYQRQNDWFTVVNNLVKKVPINSKQYYEKWKDTIKIFANDTMLRETYIKMFPKRTKSHMLEDISQSNTFLNFFWPLVFENAFMNQKLGLLGLSGKRVPRQSQKLTFFQELEKVSTIKVPVNENKIVLSFNDSDLVEGLNRAGLLESSLEFVEAGHHLFTTKEQSLITQNVNAAMDHINKTSPELYLAINQLIGCIAFYKAERPGYAGGTISSALGVTWQDPRFYEESSVRYYAEQIVHEFIHTSLFLADLVHGLYIDHRKFSEARVYSPIRKTLRNYDRTFHASYVGTGLVAFHARAGHWDRVEKFATPLLLSIDELVKVNKEFGVLTEAGEATLDAMVDFLTLIRLRN